MKPFSALYIIAILVACFVTGCQPEGTTRAEIKGNGQGGIDFQRVPNDAPAPQASSQSPAPSVKSDKGSIDVLVERLTQQQQQIDSLQAIIRAKDEEIQRLRRGMPASNPTTVQ